MARRVLRQLGAIATLAVLVALALTANAGAADGGKKVKKTKRRTVAASVDFVGTAVDNAHVKLQWGAVPGATSYRILRGGLLVGQTASTTYTDSLLWPRTAYSYEVDALTPAGTKLKVLLGQGTAAPNPATGFPRPFPATSVWNTPVGSTPVSATSADQMRYFLANSPHPNMTLRDWGVAVTEAHQNDSLFSVPCTRYSNCTLGAFGSFKIPSNAAPDPSDDGYMTVVDPGAQREWDMWQASRSGSTWSASAGAALSTAGNGTAPAGSASGDAANFPLLAGIVRPEEIAQGHIDHALVFGMSLEHRPERPDGRRAPPARPVGRRRRAPDPRLAEDDREGAADLRHVPARPGRDRS